MPFRPAPVPGSLSLLLFLSCSFFGSSITVLIFDLSLPPPLFSTHSRFSLSSSQTCCTFAPRSRYCLLLHLHSPSPQPFYPSASCFMTGYENTGAWYPKQINKKRQKSPSSRLTRMDFPADCWESASELLTQPPPPPCSFLGAWEPARGDAGPEPCQQLVRIKVSCIYLGYSAPDSQGEEGGCTQKGSNALLF